MTSIKEIEVRYSETDQMGIVYHANYLAWMEMGRTTFLKDIGFNIIGLEEMGYIFPVYAMDIKFINATRYGENIRVETVAYEIGKLRTIYMQTILNDNDEIKVKATVTIVCVRKSNFKAVRIDKELKDLYNSLHLNKNF